MAYDTDLSEAEWNYFEPISKRGSGHKHSKKSIVDAILGRYSMAIDAE